MYGEISTSLCESLRGDLTYNLLRLLDKKVGIIVSNAIRNVQKSGGDTMFRDVLIDTDGGQN